MQWKILKLFNSLVGVACHEVCRRLYFMVTNKKFPELVSHHWSTMANQSHLPGRLLFTTFLLVHTMTQNIHACDICGCSLGNGFSSVLPQYHKNFIGIRSSFARYEAQHEDNSELVSIQKSTTLELYGRYYLHKRLQLIASLPYNIKVKKELSQELKTRAIGDFSIHMNYALLNRSRDTFKWKHLLLLGAGLKLPSGENNISNLNGDLNPAMQPGSGSVDYILNTNYILRHNQIGMGNDVQYRINNENSRKYAFGNKLTIATRFFYWLNAGKNFKIIPSAGVMFEQFDRDYLEGYAQTLTGGKIYSASASCEIYFKNFLISGQYTYPINQSLSDGNLESFSRLQFNACIMF